MTLRDIRYGLEPTLEGPRDNDDDVQENEEEEGQGGLGRRGVTRGGPTGVPGRDRKRGPDDISPSSSGGGGAYYWFVEKPIYRLQKEEIQHCRCTPTERERTRERDTKNVSS